MASLHRRLTFTTLALAGAAALLALAACSAPAADAPPAKGVYFIEPADSATVTSPFKVKFGLRGMEIKPAGEQVAGTGHHHLLINQGPMPAGQIIPVDDMHLHFGKGQTETEVKLPPGQYKLTMQFADGFHLSYGPQMAATIGVTVK